MTPEERFERIERILEAHSLQGRKTDERIDAIAVRQRENSEEIRALIDAQLRTTLTLDRIVLHGIEDLKASQRKTEEMLQAFIRSLHKGGNGHT